MNNSIDHIRNLLHKCNNNTASESEFEELLFLLDQSDDTGVIPVLKQDWNAPAPVFTAIETEQIANEILVQIHNKEDENSTKRKNVFHLRSRWLAAASVVLLLIAATWLWLTQEKKPATTSMVTVPDLPPGRNGAVLTLADGTQIILDSMSNGVIAKQEGAAVRLQDGSVVYAPTASMQAAVSYNTMSTPRGRQFQITLSDGTRAWLNAESSIRFPASFAGNYRDVAVSGEVYFEVAKNTRAPFRVSIYDRVKVEVLGTSFNINAYANEPGIYATLLNGAVKIVPATAQDGAILKPGDQAQLLNASGHDVNIIKGVDVERVIAWKNGVFNFEGLELQEVLRQLERWYDIKVVYNAAPSGLKYHGGMDRQVKFSDILDVLREMGVKYEWDGRTLTIN